MSFAEICIRLGSRKPIRNVADSRTPAVSVVIPLYNKADRVAQTVESVLAQDFHDYEIIIVDDGSTDGSAEIVQAYAARLGDRCLYERQERAGAGAARNRGMELASGRFVAFLDADDPWIEQKLGSQVRFMEANPAVDWCSTNYWVASAPGVKLHTAVPHDGTPPEDAWIVVDWFSAMADRRISFQTSGVLLRRSLIDRVGEFDVTIPSGQDFDYWVRIAEDTPECGYCLAPCYTFSRDSAYSITFHEEAKYPGKVPMMIRFIERSTRSGSPPAYAELIRQVSESIIRGSLAAGHARVARRLLRSFPKDWRTPRYAGYMTLTYVPVVILRMMGRFATMRASGILGRPRAGR